MDYASLLANVERLLEKTGMSADAASKKAGHGDAIRNLRRKVAGQKATSWKLDTLSGIAKALEVQPWELLKPPGAQEQAADLRSLVRDEVNKALRTPAKKVRRKAG